jgi:hypothetical protein
MANQLSERAKQWIAEIEDKGLVRDAARLFDLLPQAAMFADPSRVKTECGTPLPSNHAGSWEQKLEAIWAVVGRGIDDPARWPTIIECSKPQDCEEELKALLSLIESSEQTGQAFLHDLDLLPEDHRERFPRPLHVAGAFARVRFEPESRAAPGLLSTPAEGIARFSNSPPIRIAGDDFVPGIALKFPVTDVASVDLLLGYQFASQRKADGTTDWNYFRHPFRNRVDTSGSSELSEYVRGKFWLFLNADDVGCLRDPSQVQAVNFLSIDHVFARSQNGAASAAQPPPFRLMELRPDPGATTRWDEQQPEDEDFRARLRTIRPGTELYTVWVGADPVGPADVLAGRLVLASRVRVSSDGDSRVYFRHRNCGASAHRCPAL